MEVDKITNKDGDEGDDVLLPGFRFHPTDEELVGFYLRRKMENKPLRVEVIEVVDVYKFDPWDLPIPSAGDEEMYFFCIRERKYRNSIRPNRVTGSGFWKATGIDRRIYDSANDCIGLKKSLVYYRGSAGKGTKTDWMMHEFRLPANGEGTNSTLHTPKDPILEAETWTLCRIFKRNASYRKYAPGWREPPSIKQRPSECSSPICSIEPVNGDKFIGSSVLRREGSMQLFDGTYETVKERARVQLSSVTPTSSMQVYSNNINFRGNEFMRDGSWDELGTIIEFAYNPALLYGRKQ